VACPGRVHRLVRNGCSHFRSEGAPRRVQMQRRVQRLQYVHSAECGSPNSPGTPAVLVSWDAGAVRLPPATALRHPRPLRAVQRYLMDLLRELLPGPYGGQHNGR